METEEQHVVSMQVLRGINKGSHCLFLRRKCQILEGIILRKEKTVCLQGRFPPSSKVMPGTHLPRQVVEADVRRI